MPRILLIDDDPDVRSVLAEALRDEGYEVIVASDGDQGLVAFRHHAPDLVITDIVMPNKDGIETIIAIRREQPHAKIIAMSAGGRQQLQRLLDAAQEIGATETLAKPFSAARLVSAVHRCLAGRDRAEEPAEPAAAAPSHTAAAVVTTPPLEREDYPPGAVTLALIAAAAAAGAAAYFFFNLVSRVAS